MIDEIWEDDGSSPNTVRLRQGDLLKFSAPDRLNDFGIVVTADCDLERRKHSRLVTLVPLLTVEELVCQCLSFDLFEFYREKLGVYCRKNLAIEEKWDDPMFQPLVRAHVRKGIDNPDVHLAACAFTHEPFDVSIQSLKHLLQCIDIQWTKATQRLSGQMSSRGDMLVLTAPPVEQEGACADGSATRIAWLRSIWQEPVAAIALKTSDAEGSRGMRVAHLRSPFQYRLTQMLGQVFSDIGLPDSPTRDAADDVDKL